MHAFGIKIPVPTTKQHFHHIICYNTMNSAVLLSGGVDSAVALALLHQAGHRISPFYCKIWLEEESFGANCPWEEDLRYAEAVCKKFGLHLHIHPMQGIYYDKIVSYVIDQLRRGYTPNPDMLCNQYIKFGAFLDTYKDSFDTIASGHYAAIEQRNTAYYLRTSPDPIKDQSYFLARLSQEQLGKALFPLGTLTKHEVRSLAQSIALPNATRKDSQGICFLGKIRYPDFVRYYLGTKNGEIRDIEDKKKLGEHKGFWFYTIGQRHGLQLSGGPWYVCTKDTTENIVYVQHVSKLACSEPSFFAITNLHWIPKELPEGFALVKIRHGKGFYQAAYMLSADKKELYLAFVEHAQGLAPGQFAALYIDTYLRASGRISYSLRTSHPMHERLAALRNKLLEQNSQG